MNTFSDTEGHIIHASLHQLKVHLARFHLCLERGEVLIIDSRFTLDLLVH